MEKLLENKVFKFAVGATVIVIALRWVFTGDLLMAVNTATTPAPEEGSTESVVSIWAVLWPMIFDACVIVGAAVIGWFTNIWDMIWSMANREQTTTTVAKQEEQPASLVQQLAQAVAKNEPAKIERLVAQIRKPYALNELQEAYLANNITLAQQLSVEIEGLLKNEQQ